MQQFINTFEADALFMLHLLNAAEIGKVRAILKVYLTESNS